MAITRIVLASHNRHKIREMQTLLETLGIELASLADFPGAPQPEETGADFAANARIKARSAVAHTGLPALADDSGLVVDALDGAPGVFSARYAGEGATDAENNRLLLKNLDGVPVGRRQARFVCAIVLALPDGEEEVFTGTTGGMILEQASGDKGFGYDPLFYSMEIGKTYGDAEAQEKNRISHRGRAMEKVIAWLADHNK